MRVALVGSSGLVGYRAPLLNGDRGTVQTIRVMRQLIDQALSDPSFIRFATEIVRSVPAHDEAGEVQAIYQWVLANIRYTKDPVTKEKLYPPQELLKIRAGDCDDMAMLISALAIALGYPARVITVGVDPQTSEFSHVYAEVELPPGSGNWTALDTARPDSEFGLSPQSFTRKRAWSLIDDNYQDLNGCSACVPRPARIPGLSGYARLGGLGDDGTDWSAVIQQTIAETPQIIAAAAGQPTTARLPGGSLVTTGNPYGSFLTPYTPGYGLTSSGYPLQNSPALFSSLLPWILLGGIILAVAKR